MDEILELFKQALSGAWGRNVGPLEVVLSLFFALLIAIYIYMVYQLIAKKSFYSKEYNMTLLGVCLITATLVITIQSSLLVSLSVGGALSIVRFRTAIKSSLDMMFLFWSIAVGIMCGTGVALYAMILSIVLTVVLYVLNNISFIDPAHILVINGKDVKYEEEILTCVKQYCKSYVVKSKNVSDKTLDYTIEIKGKRNDELVNELSKMKYIDSVSLLTYNSDNHF